MREDNEPLVNSLLTENEKIFPYSSKENTKDLTF